MTDETNSEWNQLSMSLSTTVAEVIRCVLDAKNIRDGEHLYSLTAISTVGSELCSCMY